LSELRTRLDAGEPVRGEVTIVVAGAPAPQAVAPDLVDDAIRDGLVSGRSVREVSAEVAARLGVSRREVYRRALALRATRPGQ
jgi:16S rRNA (cytidine1402-2'-O)-methyltransferase